MSEVFELHVAEVAHLHKLAITWVCVLVDRLRSGAARRYLCPARCRHDAPLELIAYAGSADLDANYACHAEKAPPISLAIAIRLPIAGCE
jgi:hypothetical protein